MRIFLIADNHFDAYLHMHRVFPRADIRGDDPAIAEQNRRINEEMVRRWNGVVKKDDLLISVGDFCYTDPRPWLARLNGNKIMIRGNHDEWCEGFAGEWSMTLEYGGQWFYITHDPAYVPRDWTNWVIHGHHHNMPEFPHIDRERKNINVAAEVVNYTPVMLDDLIERVR